MKRSTPILLVIVLLFSLSIPAPCRAQEANSPTADREDLKLFASEVPARHKDFKKLYSQPDFDNKIVALQKDIPTLSDSEVALRLMRLVVSANVGHPTVYFPEMKVRILAHGSHVEVVFRWIGRRWSSTNLS